MLRKICCIGLTLLAAVLLAACGGGSPASRPSLPTPAVPQTPSSPTLNGLPGLDGLDLLPVTFDELSTGRVTSGIRPSDFHGFYATAQSSHATEDNIFWLALPATQSSPEYAIYATDGLDSLMRLSSIKLTLDPVDAPCMVAYSDYAHNRWSLLERQPDGSFTPPGGPAACVSPSGRAYVAVLAWPQALSIHFISIDFDDAGQLAAPVGLTAAAGPNGLHLSWQPYTDPRRGSLRVKVTAPGFTREEYLGRDEIAWDVAGMSAGASYHVEVQAYSNEQRPGRISTQDGVLPTGWVHSWSEGQNDHLVGILPQQDGGVLAIGNAESDTGNTGLALRYAANGSLVSARSWPGTRFAGVTAAPGGYLIYGASALSEVNHTQALLLRLAGNGNLLWARGWHATEHNLAVSGACDPAGNTFLAVSTNWDYSAPQSGTLLKFNAAGDLVWARNRPSATRMELASLALTGDKVFFGGWEEGQPNDMLGAGPLRQGLLCCADTAGNLDWALQLQPQAGLELWLNALVPASDGGCVLGGVQGDDPYQMMYVGGPKFNHGVTGRVDSAGNLQWMNSYSSLNEQHFFNFVQFKGLAADGLGGSYSVGYQNGGGLPDGQLLCHWDGAGALLSAECFVQNTNEAAFDAIACNASQLFVGGGARRSGGGWTTAGGTSVSLTVTPVQLTDALAVITGSSSTNLDQQQKGKAISGIEDSSAAPDGPGFNQTLLFSRPR